MGYLDKIAVNNVNSVEDAMKEIEEWAKSSKFEADSKQTMEFIIRGMIFTENPIIDSVSGDKMIKMVCCG